MRETEKVIENLNTAKLILCNQQMLTPEICIRIGQAITSALALLKEQEAVKPLAKEDDSYECICGTIIGWDELDASGIVQIRLNYCPFCGKLISWEGR